MFVYNGLVCVLILCSVAARELTDGEYYQLPDLFHLDDYERCLADDEGVYCLGTFHLTPRHQPHHVYQLMQEYSTEHYAYNHTLLHRGYCISSRCPHLNSTDLPSRFQACTNEALLQDAFAASLTNFKYCQSRSKTGFGKPSVPQILFLIAVLVVLLMNVVGSVYDVRTRDDPKRSKILLAWSVIQNWKFLANCEDAKGPSALPALHGVRVCVAICTCLTHSALIYFSLFLYRPRALEMMTAHPISMLVQNSTAIELMFVVISGFLYTYALRVFAEKHRVSLRFLPLFVAKRIIRISPVYFLIVGFAATWWPALGSGPMWAAVVGAESQLCADKMWTHLLFVNNLVRAERQCLLPTWYMAVDVQMHALSSVVLLILMQFPRRMLHVLCVLFVASCALNAALAYAFEWVPIMYLTVAPEMLRKFFRDEPSYVGLYISPWGSMSSCFLGQILGHQYYEMKDGDFYMGKFKWLFNLVCIVTIPVLATWLLLGYWLQHVTAPAFVVAYAAMERSIFQILCVLSYVVFSIVNGSVIRLLAWRGWRPLARMSLTVMIAHWMVNLTLVGSSPTVLPTSFMDILLYGFTTAVYTFLIAVPITLLVEIPMKKFFDIVSSL